MIAAVRRSVGREVRHPPSIVRRSVSSVSPRRCSMSVSPAGLSPEVEELHRQAVQAGSNVYHDPTTGFVVFTELAHRKRGHCCGNQCRHCPYGWENVTSTRVSAARPVAGRGSPTQAPRRNLVTTTTTTTTRSGSDDAVKHDTVKQDTVPTTKTGGRWGGRLTDKNVPYTRGGDQGTSQLLTGERRSKDDAAFEAMGTVDELCAVIGLAHAAYQSLTGEPTEHTLAPLPLEHWLLEVMSRLFDIGSHVAKPRRNHQQDFVADGIGGGLDDHHIQELEDWIDLLTDALPELTSFILPTGALPAAHLQVARTVCRRAERRVLPLVRTQPPVCDPNALKYLNRLSDFLFAAARYVNLQARQEEVEYRRPTRGAKQRTRVNVPLHQDE